MAHGAHPILKMYLDTDMVLAIVFIVVQLINFYIMWKLKKDVRERTFLFWKEDGEGNRILVNSKGEEILKL